MAAAERRKTALEKATEADDMTPLDTQEQLEAIHELEQEAVKNNRLFRVRLASDLEIRLSRIIQA